MNKLLNSKNMNVRKQVLQNISKNNTNNVLDISNNMLLKKYNLSLIAIFKNESHILNEWIEHYIKEGVEKFYLIDNGSTDNYIHILQPYIDNQIVDLIIDTEKHAQVKLYNKYFLNKIKMDNWVIVCDLDEFIYSRNGYNRIIDYLNTVPENINIITILWKMYGSNGFIEQPESVINNFKLRKNYNKTEMSNIKSIIRGKNVRQINIHLSDCNINSIMSSDNKIVNYDVFQPISEDILKTHNLHLNHYAIQSLEWFKKIKMTRGAADTIKFENIRDLNYFKKYDYNDILDDELSNKTIS